MTAPKAMMESTKYEKYLESLSLYFYFTRSTLNFLAYASAISGKRNNYVSVRSVIVIGCKRCVVAENDIIVIGEKS